MVTYISVLAIMSILYFLTSTVQIRSPRINLRWLMLVPFIVLLIFTTNNPDYQVYKMSFETGYGPYYETGIRIVADMLGAVRMKEYKVFLLFVALLVFEAFKLWSNKTDNISVADAGTHFIILFNRS